MHGRAVIDVLAAAPTALSAWTQGAAGGVLTFIGALVLGVLAWLKERMSVEECNRRIYLSPDMLALVVALGACVGQQLFSSRTAGDLFRAVFIGLIAGMLAPWIGRFLRRIFQKKEPVAVEDSK